MKPAFEPLFPTDVAERAVSEFPARGYDDPVHGVRFTSDAIPFKGVPLGGIGTGCLDPDADGTVGQC